MSTGSNGSGTVTIVEHEAKNLLNREGINVPRGILVQDLPAELELRFPVALKVSDPSILHKTDVGGVKLNLSRESLQAEFKSMKEKFPSSSFLIEEMLPKGVEFIVGVVRDNTFGHVIMLGSGGIYTELYRDVSFRKIPISPMDAKDMLNEIKSSKFCSGFRGTTINCGSLVSLLMSVSKLVLNEDHGVETMDLNPVIVTADEAVVADAKLSLRKNIP